MPAAQPKVPSPAPVPELRTPRAPAPPRVDLPPPQLLLTLERSAYGASLHLARDAMFVLTPAALYRVSYDGTSPVESRPLPLGPNATIDADRVIYAAGDTLYAAPLSGAEPRALATLAGAPDRILAGETGVAWLRHDADGRSLLEKLGPDGPVELYRSPHRLHGAVLLADWIFAIQSRHASEFRLVGVGLNGTVRLDEPRFGRTPSMLTVAREYLYYYDGPRRAVRRVSASFGEDTSFGKDTVCSPIAVGEAIVCAQIGGIVVVDEASGQVRPLVEEPRGPITSLAVGEGRVVWIADLGRGGLGVSAVPLPR